MSNPEPTVQVPVSLIEDWATQAEDAKAWSAANSMRHLLSQPTPSAEPVSAAQLLRERAEADPGSHRESLARGYGVGDAPPRIEDMAPGTTFTCEYQDWATNGRPKQRYLCAIARSGSTSTRLCFLDPSGASLHIREAQQTIDPSTIRDVTPPKETP